LLRPFHSPLKIFSDHEKLKRRKDLKIRDLNRKSNSDDSYESKAKKMIENGKEIEKENEKMKVEIVLNEAEKKEEKAFDNYRRLQESKKNKNLYQAIKDQTAHDVGVFENLVYELRKKEFQLEGTLNLQQDEILKLNKIIKFLPEELEKKNKKLMENLIISETNEVNNKERIKVLEEELKTLQDSEVEKISNLIALYTEIKEMQLQLNSLDNEKSSLETEKKNLISENNRLLINDKSSQLEAAYRDQVLLERKMGDLNISNTDILQKFEELQKVLNKFEQGKFELSVEIDRMKKEYDHLLHKNEILKGAIADNYRSNEKECERMLRVQFQELSELKEKNEMNEKLKMAEVKSGSEAILLRVNNREVYVREEVKNTVYLSEINLRNENNSNDNSAKRMFTSSDGRGKVKGRKDYSMNLDKYNSSSNNNNEYDRKNNQQNINNMNQRRSTDAQVTPSKEFDNSSRIRPSTTSAVPTSLHNEISEISSRRNPLYAEKYENKVSHEYFTDEIEFNDGYTIDEKGCKVSSNCDIDDEIDNGEDFEGNEITENGFNDSTVSSIWNPNEMNNKSGKNIYKNNFHANNELRKKSFRSDSDRNFHDNCHSTNTSGKGSRSRAGTPIDRDRLAEHPSALLNRDVSMFVRTDKKINFKSLIHTANGNAEASLYDSPAPYNPAHTYAQHVTEKNNLYTNPNSTTDQNSILNGTQDPNLNFFFSRFENTSGGKLVPKEYSVQQFEEHSTKKSRERAFSAGSGVKFLPQGGSGIRPGTGTIFQTLKNIPISSSTLPITPLVQQKTLSVLGDINYERERDRDRERDRERSRDREDESRRNSASKPLTAGSGTGLSSAKFQKKIMADFSSESRKLGNL
jgi:hypothetical protein